MLTLNFSSLPIKQLRAELTNTNFYQQLIQADSADHRESLSWAHLKQEWHSLQQHRQNQITNDPLTSEDDLEPLEVNWLIKVFNKAFSHYNVTLVRGEYEPEYFPANQEQPARIQFAHGFFRSALHELSHWSLAGAHRRTLPDFGYWYAPDGRTEAQQQEFERVEIKPQAIECLLALMCHKKFDVSQDNLDADFDTSQSTFKQDVYIQAKSYIAKPSSLPKDAQRLLILLTYLCHDTIE